MTDQRGNLRDELERTTRECAQLREENARLRSLLDLGADGPGAREEPAEPAAPSSKPREPAIVNTQSTAEAKIALFRGLLEGRDDVFAVRWEGKGGRSGYSPACGNEWKRPLCAKPRVKCADCEHRDLLTITDAVIKDHLEGKRTVGTYALLPDESCRFLAIDFDKTSWREDVAAFLDTCDEADVPVALERSRSGKGGHLWIFFERTIHASQARKLGCALLTRTMERRHEIGLDSYDRLFPSQDTLPKGGFGSLIALPLQRGPRDKGNSVFLDPGFQPYTDQWAFLSTARRMRIDEVDNIVDEAAGTGSIVGVRISPADNTGSATPWTLPPSGKQAEKPIAGPFPDAVKIVRSNLVYVEKEGLPSPMLDRLVRLAAFQNPEFYQAQAMRLSTFGKPRVIGCAEDFLRHIGLPRGCLDEAMDLLHAHQVEVEITDERVLGKPIGARFHGRLTPRQRKAAKALLAHDDGVLSAATAFGKTVVAARVIGDRGVSTLVLVHRRQLMDQWRERLAAFLNLPIESIGQIGGGKMKPNGLVDIGVMQSLIRKGEVKDVVAEYGQIIVDECHHVSAFSFEQVLKQAKARYVLGLTATPVRKDGHQPIIMMQCGPIRFQESAKKQAAARPFEHVVVPRYTAFRLRPDEAEATIQQIYAALSRDTARNDLIVSDVVDAVTRGRSPVVLTERTEHLESLAERLGDCIEHVVVLRGGTGVKKRRAIAETLAAIRQDEGRVLIATGRYIGEGFDDARLDTLFLAMPISWKGTLQQYAGRLHRLYSTKRVVQVYDYVDTEVPMLARMYEKRLKGYAAMGYEVQQWVPSECEGTNHATGGHKDDVCSADTSNSRS